MTRCPLALACVLGVVCTLALVASPLQTHAASAAATTEEAADLPLAAAMINLHHKEKHHEHEHEKHHHEREREHKHDHERESKHSHHHHGREPSDEQVTPAAQVAPGSPSAPSNPGQQYYQNYYNPAPVAGGANGGANGGAGQQQQGGYGGGYDYSQYYNPNPARSGGSGGNAPSTGEGEASDPIRSGAEGSSSNIRASGEMAQGFMPGHQPTTQPATRESSDHGSKHDHERSHHHDRTTLPVTAATVQLAQRALDTIQLSEKHEHEHKHDHEKHHEEDKHAEDDSKDHHHVKQHEEAAGHHHADEKSRDREGTSAPPTQEELNAEWQKIGQQYAKAFIPKDPPAAIVPATVTVAAARDKHLSHHEKKEEKEQAEQPQQPQQPDQAEQAQYWKEIGMNYKNQYAPPPAPQATTKKSRHSSSQAAVDRDIDAAEWSALSDESAGTEYNALDSMTRDPANIARAQRVAEERNEKMAKRIRRQDERRAGDREEDHLATEARTTETATSEALATPIVLVDAAGVAAVAVRSSSMFSFPKMLVIMVAMIVAGTSLWMIHDSRTRNHSYERIGTNNV